jgi:hypothetical protein
LNDENISFNISSRWYIKSIKDYRYVYDLLNCFFLATREDSCLRIEWSQIDRSLDWWAWKTSQNEWEKILSNSKFQTSCKHNYRCGFMRQLIISKTSKLWSRAAIYHTFLELESRIFIFRESFFQKDFQFYSCEFVEENDLLNELFLIFWYDRDLYEKARCCFVRRWNLSWSSLAHNYC